MSGCPGSGPRFPLKPGLPVFPCHSLSLTTLPLSILFGHTKIIPTAWTFTVSHVWHVLTLDLRMTVLSYFQALFQ